ncbi:hypothetical protein [Komagataeibacter rhaeticus]|uniref:hypothetical protein n=1 Tax=Komagataeibacter rhaeticus TaxID=215221 RepID=UPI0015E8A137|nr:hypothetical protein [Komagataeibacter rhaeticus]
MPQPWRRRLPPPQYRIQPRQQVYRRDLRLRWQLRRGGGHGIQRLLQGGGY